MVIVQWDLQFISQYVTHLKCLRTPGNCNGHARERLYKHTLCFSDASRQLMSIVLHFMV